MKPVVFDPTARRELDQAATEYEAARPGLGGAFLDEADRALGLIAAHPDRWPSWRGTAFRRRPLRRFPYAIFYRERETYLWIVAVAHNRRRPGYWYDRKTNGRSAD